MVCRTLSIGIGEKLPSVVFTKDEKIIVNDKLEGCQINFAFNAVKYSYGGQLLVLGDAHFLFNIM
jgi:hypothetical protein